MNATAEITTLKAAHRDVWNSGDYALVAERLVQEVADVAVATAALRPGDEVLDVATGSGNAAIPAAEAGATVTGLDIATSLLDAGRDRARRAGVEVTWLEGDAEALPFEDESFDAVLSVLGVQFAPRHEVTAQEVARVLRPGGRLVLCNWTPGGFIGQQFATMSRHLPKPPEGASPPPLWGDDSHVADLFTHTGVTVSCEPRSVVFEESSPEAFVDFLTENYGPVLKARERLAANGAWESLRTDLVALCERVNLAADGFLTPSEYVVVRGRKEG
jgi:ubiquinone/menaquinone biosynthesis C-methylase UbiE